MKNVPKVLQNRPHAASEKGFPTPSKPYQKGGQATYKFHQPSFPKQAIRHTPPLQLTAQQTEKARPNGQKAQKARFHRRNTEAGGSRKAEEDRFLSEKDMYAEKQTGKYAIRFTRLPPPFRPTGIICHATLPPHGTFSAKWCNALHQPLQRAA